MLRSDLCDFSDAYIVVKGTITLTTTNGRGFIDIGNRFLAFENNTPFTNSISKVNNALIDNEENQDAVMSMYNFLEYSKNYKKTTVTLWNYYRDEPDNPPLNPAVYNNPSTVNYNADPLTNSESFKNKSSITGKTSNANQEDGENTEQGNTKTKKILGTIVPLKYLSTFWRSLDMSLINCEVSLILSWSKNCVLIDITIETARNGHPDADPPVEARERKDAPTNAAFKVTDTQLYVPVATFSTEDDNIFLNQEESVFKRTIKWNKYRSEMTNQNKTNNLSYLIDPAFTKVNRLFVLSFENEEDRTSFSKYYVPKVERKRL